jgi:ComEC/Rec2-related protein
MVTGHETWIERDDVDAMRDSGLAHILSISGLHMAVVGGFVFFLVRLLVAAWPWLALRVSGKKVAAVAGLIAVGTYLVISGSPPPAERAAITYSIAFIAILLDRQAITMHALAVAALIVLAVQPEAIVTPGFQMSFAATAALVALVESWPPRVREISAPWPILIVQRVGGWVTAAVLASLVAGLATGPFAMQHFNRTAIYGLGANLATSPVADFRDDAGAGAGGAAGADGPGRALPVGGGQGDRPDAGHRSLDGEPAGRGADGGQRAGLRPADRLPRRAVHLSVEGAAALAGPAAGGGGDAVAAGADAGSVDRRRRDQCGDPFGETGVGGAAGGARVRRRPVVAPAWA